MNAILKTVETRPGLPTIENEIIFTNKKNLELFLVNIRENHERVNKNKKRSKMQSLSVSITHA